MFKTNTFAIAIRRLGLRSRFRGIRLVRAAGLHSPMHDPDSARIVVVLTKTATPERRKGARQWAIR